jgi:hypothetical protein
VNHQYDITEIKQEGDKVKRLIRKAQLLEVYHGTSSDRADSIRSTGLKIVVGGDGDGAYVSSDYEDAKGYAIKRAGEKRRYADRLPQFADVYPVMIVVKIDDSELKQGYKTNMFAPEGIGPDKIVDVIDLSNEEPFQALLKAMELEKENGDKDEILNLYQQYTSYVFKYV